MPPEATLPIDTAGRLAIRSPGGVDLFLEARGATLQVEVRTLGDLLRLRRDMPRAAGPKPQLAAAAAATRLADLECVVSLRRREIARIGPRTRPNWLGRLLGLTPARIDWRGLLTSLVVRDRSS
jgi:hypothetical protein